MPGGGVDGLPYRDCVGVAVVNRDGKVFVGQRRDNSADAWQMPQGGIDEGESPQLAALRELEEETGISSDLVVLSAEIDDWVHYDLPEELVPTLWGGKYRGQRQKWLLLEFRGEDHHVNIETKEPEFSTWKWADPEDLVDMIVPFKREVYATVLETFGERIEQIAKTGESR
ncbi:RNA pyrophosphohydrolase [Aestuariibius insulae]|uniref:RNA pyrophosphohydrolase n=1 Tax=Aestuariibius insulae TaxID=2058287 RepID=UPI00345E85A3